MAITQLNTRIKLRYDTYANWTDNNPILLKGEVAIVEVPATSATTPNKLYDEERPSLLFKVGVDPTHAVGSETPESTGYRFNQLPWGSALAADVYAWAKAANKPSYNASEITLTDSAGNTQQNNVEDAIAEIYGAISNLTGGAGTISQQIAALTPDDPNAPGTSGVQVGANNYITGLKVDGNGHLTLQTASLENYIKAITGTPDSGKTLQGEIDDVEAAIAILNGNNTTTGSVAKAVKDEADRIDGIVGTPDSGKTLQGEIDDVEADIATLNGDDTTAGSVAKSIKDAIDNLDLDNTYAGIAYEGKVDTLIGNVSGDDSKSARTMAAEEVAKIVANAPASYDTLKEIADWIQSDQTGAAKMANDITALQTKTELGTYDNDGTPTQYATVKAYVEAVTGDIDSDLTALEGRVDTAEDDIDALETAIGTLNGNASTSGSVAYAVAQEATRIDAITGTPDNGKTLQGEIDDVETAIGVLNGDNTTTGSVAKAVKDAIDAIDYTVTAPEITSANQTDATFVNVLTGFEIENGGLKTNTTTSQTLAKVATTGNVNDLVQSNGTFLILNGGDSTIDAAQSGN